MLTRFALLIASASFVAAPAAAQAPLFRELHRTIPSDRDLASAVLLADVDGDGDRDLLVGNAGANRLRLNDGLGVFAETSGLLPGDSDFTTALALGDVDGDGDPDLLVGNSGQNKLYVSDGTGVFSDATGQLPVFNDPTTAVVLEDVDGDGDLDALIGNGATFPPPPDRLFLNDGTGTFTNASGQLPPGATITNALATGDVDADGDRDVLVGVSGLFSSQNRLHLNDGLGSFSNGTAQLPTVGDGTIAVALADVDGDLDLDAVIANSGLNRLHLNDGAGVFTEVTATQLPADAESTVALDLDDVDGDGDLDILFGNRPVCSKFFGCSGGQDLLYLNDGAGTFSDATPSQLPQREDDSADVALGDVDGDGDADALIAVAGGGLLSLLQQDRLFLNDGVGGFTDVTSPPQLPAERTFTRELALADVDGDGDLDAYLVTAFEDVLLLNDGAAFFGDASAQLPGISDSSFGLALADVDGNGTPDAFVGNVGQNRLYTNDGTGMFSDATTQLPADTDDTSAVALEDVDGDGDRDALMANITIAGQQDRLYENDGLGTFSDVTNAQLPPFPAFSQSLAVGDVDADMDLDVVFADAFQDRLYENDGAGSFSDVTALQMPLDSDGTPDVTLGDVDGDGDLDLLLGKGLQNRLYTNDGAGNFTDATGQLPTLNDPTLSVDLVDVDGDGDLDAVIGNTQSQDRLHRNDGAGLFTEATQLLPAETDTAADVGVGDLDLDGDVDLLIGSAFTPSVLWTNTTRLVAWRNLPAIGKPLNLDLAGSSGGFYVLARSFGTFLFALPPFGNVLIDPTTLLVIGSGALDADGRAGFVVSVPNDPAIVGLDVFFQGAVGVPFRFTNREPTELSGL